MTVKNQNGSTWTELIKPYDGEWVALTLDGEKVVSHSKNRKKAVEEARAKGVRVPFVVKAPFDYEWM